MESQRPIDALSIEGNALLDNKGKAVATFPKNLDASRVASYAHLFSTASELLNVVEEQVSAGIEQANMQPRRRPSLTGYTFFEPRIPNWVDRAIQAIALAYGEPSNIGEEVCGLAISATDANVIEDDHGDIVVSLTGDLEEVISTQYMSLFLAAPVLLQIVEEMAKDGLEEINQEYDSGKEFDPAGADVSRVLVPDRLRLICDLAAKAKGAVPIRG